MDKKELAAELAVIRVKILNLEKTLLDAEEIKAKEMNVADPAGPERLKNVKELAEKVLGKDGISWMKDQLRNWGVKGTDGITIKHVADLTRFLADIEKKQIKSHEEGEDIGF